MTRAANARGNSSASPATWPSHSPLDPAALVLEVDVPGGEHLQQRGLDRLPCPEQLPDRLVELLRVVAVSLAHSRTSALARLVTACCVGVPRLRGRQAGRFAAVAPAVGDAGFGGAGQIGIGALGKQSSSMAHWVGRRRGANRGHVARRRAENPNGAGMSRSQTWLFPASRRTPIRMGMSREPTWMSLLRGRSVHMGLAIFRLVRRTSRALRPGRRLRASAGQPRTTCSLLAALHPICTLSRQHVP